MTSKMKNKEINVGAADSLIIIRGDKGTFDLYLSADENVGVSTALLCYIFLTSTDLLQQARALYDLQAHNSPEILQ